jgi:hypothetical protein
VDCGGAGVVSGANLGSVEIVLVKAGGAGDRDRVYLEVEGEVRRGPVHVVHDLPHLVVESLFGIGDGLWAELAAGLHPVSGSAATARDSKRNKLGRIVSGDAASARTDDWLTAGHRVAKTVTNCVANRWGDGPDTPAGVRVRIAREGSAAEQELLGRLDDETVALAIEAVRELGQRWAAVPPGGTLRLWWPLPASFFPSGAS